MNTTSLTATERLVLNNLSRDPAGGTSAVTLSTALDLHQTTINAVLRSLRDHHLTDFIVRKGARHHFRTNRQTAPTSTIAPGTALDDAVSSLTAAAKQCGRYQEALLAIAKILAEAGVCQELHAAVPASEELTLQR